MQGNCSAEPSAAALGISGPNLVARKPGQCVLVTDVRLMKLDQNLWIDNVYIRHQTTNVTDTPNLVHCWGSYCNLWLTSVTVQGDMSRLPSHGGVEMRGGQLYAEGAITLRACKTWIREPMHHKLYSLAIALQG
jgi:hypothetical protein